MIVRAGIISGFAFAAVALAASPCLAVSTYMGIQPGKSTRSDVEGKLGRPAQGVSESMYEYAVPGGSGKIIVEYRNDQVVDRLERRFVRPVSRSALIRSLELPAEAEESGKTKDGKLVEYFGDILTMALIYAGEDAKSGVQSVGYYSMELYSRSLDTARNPQVQFDPTACTDLYIWSQTEREAAKKSKNVGRYQAILEIGILSQRGECQKARVLTATYKKLNP